MKRHTSIFAQVVCSSAFSCLRTEVARAAPFHISLPKHWPEDLRRLRLWLRGKGWMAKRSQPARERHGTSWVGPGNQEELQRPQIQTELGFLLLLQQLYPAESTSGSPAAIWNLCLSIFFLASLNYFDDVLSDASAPRLVFQQLSQDIMEYQISSQQMQLFSQIVLNNAKLAGIQKP